MLMRFRAKFYKYKVLYYYEHCLEICPERRSNERAVYSGKDFDFVDAQLLTKIDKFGRYEGSSNNSVLNA